MRSLFGMKIDEDSTIERSFDQILKFFLEKKENLKNFKSQKFFVA